MDLNQEYCNEFDDLKVGKLFRDVFITLADNLMFDWKKLARFLEISDKEIDIVLKDFETTKEQIYEILNGWCSKNPNKKWRDIKSGLNFCNRIDVISKCERMLLVHSIFGVQPSSEKLFPRDEELHKIHQYFIKSKDTKGSTLVLCGMSGVGKTQIARKYCETYCNFYKNIAWMDASFTKLKTSMNNLCDILGLIVQDNYFSLEEIIEKIHNYYKNEKTLYIFDSVDDESVKNLGMYISKKPNSFTLITSQWRTWSNSVNKMLINVFNFDDAYLYVKNNIEENNEENIRNLIKELGYHPFAITQAIKYIKIHKISISKYLDRFRSKPLEILDNDNFPIEENSKSAIKAINMVLMKLEKTKIIPLQILNCLSHCDGENISKKFIIEISKHLKINEEYLIDEAMGLLISYSLLDRFDNEIYSMHKLTQLSCKKFQNKNLSTNTYLELIENYFQSMLDKVIDHVNYGNYFVIHFLHLFRTNRKRMSNVFCRSAVKMKCFLTSKCLFQEALEILYAVQSCNERTFGDNNVITLDTKFNIALCLNNMGKYNQALEIYNSVIKIQIEILGINDPSTMITKHNIARCFNDMGKYNEALEIYYSVDKIQTEILGINHPSTMTTKNNIANCLYAKGKYNKALEIYYSVDNIQTEILGINHPSVMATKNSIADCLKKMGKYNEALEIYYSVDKIQTEILGINHRSTMTTKHNVASCLNKMGKYNEALEIYYSVDKIQTDILGINHPSTMKTKNNIAICLYNMGKYNKALEILYHIDKIGTDILGINNLLTIDIKCTIGHCFLKLGKYTDAIDIFYFVDKMQTEILGVNHPSTMRTKSNIGVCLQNLDNCLVESNLKKIEKFKNAALKCFYLKHFQKVAEFRSSVKVNSSVDLLDNFVELCLVDAEDVRMDLTYRVELMEFLKKQKHHKAVQYNKVFKEENDILLISGIAGIGKSWLLRKCLLDWSNNKIWEKVEFLFYFECRILNQYQNISNIKELLDFFYKDFVKDLDIHNHNILFMIDGLDEFKYLDDLVNYKSSSKYPIVNTLAEIECFKSVVAGRVYAIDRYQSAYSMPSYEMLTIQIMGFNDNGIYNYLENNVIEEKKEFVKSFFKDTPIAKAMASVPFYLSIMCKIIVESKERDFSFLTMTDLYASIFLYFLKNHITKNEIPIYKIMEKENNKKYVLNICKIAYELFVENKVIFSKEEIQLFISDFDEVEDKLLGFIERIETDLGYYYQFAHVTIMEFCASVYAYNSFSGEEIVVNKNLRSCLSMICGLTNKSQNSLLKYLANLNNSNNEKLSMIHIGDFIEDQKTFIECFYEAQASITDNLKFLIDKQRWIILIEDRKTSYEVSCENYFVNQLSKSGKKLERLDVNKYVLTQDENKLIIKCLSNVSSVRIYFPFNIDLPAPKDKIEYVWINLQSYLVLKEDFQKFIPLISICEELTLFLHDDTDFFKDIYEWIRALNFRKLTIKYRNIDICSQNQFKDFLKA